MQSSRLRQILDAAQGRPVLCVGDVMLDRFVYGVVDRISPEAPVPVLRQTRTSLMPGGAANVVRNLASLGLAVTLIGAVGDDEAGAQLAALLAELPSVTSHLVPLQHRPTTLKTRLVAGGQQLLRLDAEEVGAPDAASEATLITHIERSASFATAILLSDYAKGVLTDRVITAALAAGRARGIPVIADPKGRDFSRYGAVDLLKPNAAELALAIGLPTATTPDIDAALTAARDRFPAQSIVVTRAAQGISYIQRESDPRHVAGTAREVFDVSGAGDTSLAALAAARVGGASLGEAVAIAILASGIAVGKSGTATVTRGELQAAVEAPARTGTAPLLTLEAMVGQVERWRSAGLRIGFTNGVFDIIHPGHVRVLEEARGRCDRLIVGLNTDESVRRLKGPQRPVNDAESRARVLCGLTAVDGVVIFAEDTPLNLITALRPDVLVKGGDYSRDTIVGADIVEASGGEVVIVPIVPGQSTTAIIARSRKDA